MLPVSTKIFEVPFYGVAPVCRGYRQGNDSEWWAIPRVAQDYRLRDVCTDAGEMMRYFFTEEYAEICRMEFFRIEDGEIVTEEPFGDIELPSTAYGTPVVEIYDMAFAGCTKITSVVIPDGVARIGDYAFSDCSGLRSVTIPGSVTDIGAYAFHGCTGLTDVVFPASLTDVNIQSGALENVPLTVIVADDTQTIPAYVSEYVRKVVFEEGVTRIPDNFFSGCSGLRTMDIPESVLMIGTNVFEACSALDTVVTNGMRLHQGWCLGFADAGGGRGATALPEGVRGIAAGAFEGEYGIETVAFPASLRFVGARALMDCTGLEGIALPDGVLAVDRDAFRNCTYAQELSLPETLREIGDGAFANCAQLMGVTLPDGVQDVGACAFSNCWRMLSASIPSSVTNMGADAFKECRRLVGVTVPLGLAPMTELFPSAFGTISGVVVADRRIGEGAPCLMVPGMFAGCAAMTDLTLPDGLEAISEDAFAGCVGMAAFSLPDTVTNIGARAFKDLAQLTSFAFPTGLVAVGEEAFAGCVDFGALALPEGLKSIGARAFHGMSLLARVDIPGSVETVGTAAFGGCERVRAVSLPGNVATMAEMFPDTYGLIASATVVGRTGDRDTAPDVIAASLFEGCAALVAVEMPSSLVEIGARAFKGCAALTAAGIPSGVTGLGEEAFAGCASLSQLALPNGLAVLPSRAFAGCTSLTEVTVPESVTALGANVFTGCDLLRSVRFVGNAPTYDSAAYGGTDAALVSYVPNGSMGWDGVATSKALPEFWPYGTAHEIAWWEPNRFLVDFVASDATGGTVTAQVEQVTGTTYALPADATRQGAVFGGWWTAAEGGARVTAVTQVALMRPHTFYAHWTFNRYAVQFDANGGEGTMDGLSMTVASSSTLPENGFSRAGYAFVGWATEPGGEVAYANAAEVTNLAYEQGACVTLYAVWEERDWTLADYVDAPSLALSNDASAAWAPDWTTFKVGGVSLRSGVIAAAEDEGGRTRTSLTATVTGEGGGSFWWKVSCEEMDEEYGEWYDYAVFSIDGVEIAKIAGKSDWEQVNYTVSGAGTHTLAWTFTRDDYDEDETAYENAAWVDGVVWTPKAVTVTFAAGGAQEGEVPDSVVKHAGYEMTLPGAGTLANGEYVFMGWTDGVETYAAGSTFVFPASDVTLTAVWAVKTWTLHEAVDADALSFTTGGDADWTVDTATGWTNGVSAKSGIVVSGGSSWIEMTVRGEGTLVFRWNVMGGIYRNNPFAYAKVEVDGTKIAQEHQTGGWKEQTVEIEGAGTHTVRWTYLRTSSRSADGDCAWLDAVAWTSSGASDVIVDVGGGKSVTVPGTWIAEHSAIIAAAGGDTAAALKTPSANGRLSIADCYVLGLDPESAMDDFKISAFPMKADGTPDLENIAVDPPQAQWNVPGARAVIRGAATLDAENWPEVTDENKASFRFFKVTVELP